MRTAILLVMALTLAAATGCATRQHILTANAVSMTHFNKPDKFEGKEIGAVNERFCTNEDAQASQTMDVGLMDEVILKAQNATKATFIQNAAFYAEGRCIVLEGMAVK